MAKPRSNSEMVHRFCNGYREHVNVGNMTIEGAKIFSYRLMIGRYIGETLVIFGDSTTNTTNQHLSKLRYAAGTQTKLHVLDVTSSTYNAMQVRRYLPDLLLKASKARANREMYLNEAKYIMAQANAFFDLEENTTYPRFDVAKELGVDLAELAKAARQAEKLKRQKLIERAARIAADNAEAISKWRDDTSVCLPWNVAGSADTMLRVVGDEIETSRGAKVPLSVAPTLWKMVLRAKAKHNDYTPGIELGHYKLNKISSEGDITVGCHFIKFRELERMARKLDYVS